MPSASGKCRGPVIRQHSLQNQSPLQSPAGHRLKKQLSEDDHRIYSFVEITGQGWTDSLPHNPVLRIGCGEGRIGQTKVSGGRPKPAKVAWADKKQESTENPLGVEVVAKKCQGQPRPLSVKAQRFQNPLIGNKETLAYTRLQLAERLRNAWSERDKTKPNINIFLAHASDTTRSDDSPSSEIQDNVSTLSDTADRKPRALQMRAFSQQYRPPEMRQVQVDRFRSKPQEEAFKPEKDDDVSRASEMPDSPAKNVAVEGETNETVPHLQLNKIEIRVTTNADDQTDPGIENKKNFEISGESQEENRPLSIVQPVVLTAKDRRANFRSSSMLHNAITESFSLPLDEDEKLKDVSDDGKKANSKKVLVRAFSAPSYDQSFQKPNIQQKTVKFLPQKRLQSITTYDPTDMSPEDLTAMRERIKSASIRRKLKSAAARRKNKDKTESSSEEEKESRDSTERSKKTTRRSRGKNGNDIITMVSLVSPAESDTEESVINLPIETIPAGEVKEDAQAQVKTPGNQEIRSAAPFMVQKFVSLRKTPKTVTFQTNPVVTRNYSTSFPSRRAPAGTPIIIPSPVISNPALTPAQLQERDKRPPIFPGADGRGIKRRLIRSPSEPVKENDSYEEKPKPCKDSPVYDNNFSEFSGKFNEKEKAEDRENPEDGEPQFKCPKEKECWALYKKMVAKGVAVTFDTVLRGMLTPTEYRLKKNRLLSTG